MSDLSKETEELLRRARDAGEMPAARRRKLKGALLGRIAVASSTAVAGPVAASILGGGAKVVVGLAVALSLGTGGYLVMRRHHADPPARPAPPSAVAAAEPLPAEAPAPPAPAPRRLAAPRRPARHVALREAPDESIIAETALLRDTDRALRAGDPRAALALLERHRARFPHGILVPERDAATLMARCQLATTSRRALDADVDVFLAAYVGSPLAARVRAACGPPDGASRSR
jgi:hypothetical protein